MNIKGHVKFELFDAKTGKLEKKIENHNMLTKALYYFFDQGGMTNPSAFNASAIRSDALTYLLGGVMCLDTALTESDELVRIPKGVGMTANGAVGVVNNDTPTEFGSYNSVESGWQQDGSLKMVWDWTTSQGNGTIACVGLSSYFGGYAGIGNRTSKGTKSGNTAIGSYNSYTAKGMSGQYIGYKGNKVQNLISDLQYVTEWTVKEYAFPLTVTDIRDNITEREVAEYTVSLPASLQNLQPYYESGGYRPWAYIAQYQNGDNVYMMIAPRYDNSWLVGICKVITYSLATHSVTNVTEWDFTNETFARTRKYGVSDKWLMYGDILVEMATPANVVETEKNANIVERFYPISSDIFYSSGSMVDMDFEEENPINGNGVLGALGTSENPLLMYGGSAILRDPRYIATIYNLQNPVTKTGDKTMKVTYILRFS